MVGHWLKTFYNIGPQTRPWPPGWTGSPRSWARRTPPAARSGRRRRRRFCEENVHIVHTETIFVNALRSILLSKDPSFTEISIGQIACDPSGLTALCVDQKLCTYLAQ